MKLEQKIGVWFEGEVETALKEIQATQAAMWHRFTDSKAARNLVKAQPGDHMLIIWGIPILIEEKCSIKYDSLRKGFSALWPKKQAAKHRLWHRAGGPSLIIFCDYDQAVALDFHRVEIWKGEPLARARSTGSPISKHIKPEVEGVVNTLEQDILKVITDISRGYQE